MKPVGRIIHSRTADRQLSDLLQLIFTAELIAPGRCIWLVSPWISDIPVLDNRTNGYSTINPEWPATEVRLSSVLCTLLERGTTVHIASRTAEHNIDLLDRLRSYDPRGTLPLILHDSEELHEKGLLGDEYYLSGSMNFTYSGIRLNEEAVHFHTAPEVVAESRIVFSNRWGGPRHG